jgi:hypothetical protein
MAEDKNTLASSVRNEARLIRMRMEFGDQYKFPLWALGKLTENEALEYRKSQLIPQTMLDQINTLGRSYEEFGSYPESRQAGNIQKMTQDVLNGKHYDSPRNLKLMDTWRSGLRDLEQNNTFRRPYMKDLPMGDTMLPEDFR